MGKRIQYIYMQEDNFISISFNFNIRNPIGHCPGHAKAAIAIKFNPKKFKLMEGTKSYLALPYRYIFAVATQDSIVLYDTQHMMPICLVSNLHYATLTDISWTHDGLSMVISSSDGFCSLVEYQPEELGTEYVEPVSEAEVNAKIPMACEDDIQNSAITINDDSIKPITCFSDEVIAPLITENELAQKNNVSLYDRIDISPQNNTLDGKDIGEAFNQVGEIQIAREQPSAVNDIPNSVNSSLSVTNEKLESCVDNTNLQTLKSDTLLNSGLSEREAFHSEMKEKADLLMEGNENVSDNQQLKKRISPTFIDRI